MDTFWDSLLWLDMTQAIPGTGQVLIDWLRMLQRGFMDQTDWLGQMVPKVLLTLMLLHVICEVVAP